MIIHILRHAEAIERSPEIEEEHRYLTSSGRVRFRKAAGSISKLEIEPDLIITSPLVRAVQTAEILAETLAYSGDLPLNSRLAPGFRPQDLDALLALYPQAKEVVLVGHEPDLGILTSSLLGADAPCTLKKGAMVSVKRGTGEGGAEFLQLVTGGGKVVSSRSKALERMQGG